MVKYRIAIINLAIVLGYFLLYLELTWNTSGGDIFLIFISLVSILIHIIITVILFFKSKGNLFQALCGIGIGLITCFLVYKTIEQKKDQITPTIEISFLLVRPDLASDPRNWNNPTIGKWMLAANFLHYEHSSAAFYEDGRRG